MTVLDMPLSEEQLLLRHSLQRLLASQPRPSWHDLSSGPGLGGVTLPEEAGGFGGGATDIALVMAEL